MNEGEKISRYNTQLTVANFTGKRKKIQSGYFIATPRVVYTVEGSVHNFINNQIAAVITSIITDVTLALDQTHKSCAPPVHILRPATDIIPITDYVLAQCGKPFVFVKARRLKISLFIEGNLQHVSTI